MQVTRARAGGAGEGKGTGRGGGWRQPLERPALRRRSWTKNRPLYAGTRSKGGGERGGAGWVTLAGC